MGIRVVTGESQGTLAIAPAEEAMVADEQMVISDSDIAMWAGGTTLPGATGEQSEIRLWGCLKPGTLVVRPAPGAAPLEPGKDYEANETWGALKRLPEGKIPDGATVYASYTYGFERLDGVQIDNTGRASIRKGENVKYCAPSPSPEPGCRIIANIYVPYHTKVITSENIYLIGLAIKPIVSANPHQFVSHTIKKLQQGQPITVVFLGDSVTAGGNASQPALRFPELFTSRLQKLYPQAKIAMVNAGAGGTNSDFGMERLDKDVLAHKPDLVVIEFVNDCGFKPEHIKANCAELGKRIRAGGETDILYCTPHLVAELIRGDYENRVQAMREAAKEHGFGLADVTQMWHDLKIAGLPYMTLLVNRINHPDDRGHKMFADALLAFFEQAK
jgi:lysophospholipase L1-like esterase